MVHFYLHTQYVIFLDLNYQKENQKVTKNEIR